ncbi:unnamed protein product [Lactuca virosa]|uniref:Uncharacterized protein n=1 Tax=Lactuca virosa TaxID=75947 RepID=A0AAU9MDC8_9ASTR|nr:unnamed protein product [Lactuca virosa]
MGSEYLPKLLLQSSNTQQSDFDGHGGSEASSYVKDQVMKLFFHHNSLACNFLSNYQLILLHGFTNVVPSNPVLHQWIEVESSPPPINTTRRFIGDFSTSTTFSFQTHLTTSASPPILFLSRLKISLTNTGQTHHVQPPETGGRTPIAVGTHDGSRDYR